MKTGHYLSDSTCFSLRNYLLKAENQALGRLRVGKVSRAYLDRRRSNREVIKHVFHLLDASKPNYRNFHSLSNVPYQLEGDGLNGGARQASGRVPEAGPAGVKIDGHRGVSICHGKGVSPCFSCCTGCKSNVCNERRELDP